MQNLDYIFYNLTMNFYLFATNDMHSLCFNTQETMDDYIKEKTVSIEQSQINKLPIYSYGIYSYGMKMIPDKHYFIDNKLNDDTCHFYVQMSDTPKFPSNMVKIDVDDGQKLFTIEEMNNLCQAWTGQP